MPGAPSWDLGRETDGLQLGWRQQERIQDATMSLTHASPMGPGEALRHPGC